MLVPGGLIKIVDFAAARPGCDSFIVRKDCLRYPIHATLDSPNADGNPEHRFDEFLHSAAAAALTSTQLSNQGGKPCTISNLETLRDHAPAGLATVRTLPFLQDEMRNLHLDFGKLDMLMSVERSQVLKLPDIRSHMASVAPAPLRWVSKRLLVPFVAFFGSGLALFPSILSSLSGTEGPTREGGSSSSNSAQASLPVLPRAWSVVQ